MENPLLANLMGTSAAPQTNSKPKSEKGDPDAFSKELDKAGEKEQSSKTRNFISDDKQAKQDDKKDSAGKKAEAEKNETQDQKLQQKHMSKLNGYLYDVAYKNTDTMSLGEKQAMRLAEFSNVGLHEVKNMLNERGLGMRDMSFTQLANATKDGSHKQVAGHLDELAKEKHEPEEDFEKLVDGETKPQKDLAKEIRSTDLTAEVKAQAKADDVRHDRQVVISQIMQHIEVRNLANKTEISLKLNPEYLGDVSIKLVHGKEGIKAHFETTSRVTREVIEENEEELRTNANDKGVRLNEVTVELVDAV